MEEEAPSTTLRHHARTPSFGRFSFVLVLNFQDAFSSPCQTPTAPHPRLSPPQLVNLVFRTTSGGRPTSHGDGLYDNDLALPFGGQPLTIASLHLFFESRIWQPPFVSTSPGLYTSLLTRYHLTKARRFEDDVRYLHCFRFNCTEVLCGGKMGCAGTGTQTSNRIWMGVTRAGSVVFTSQNQISGRSGFMFTLY